MIARSTKPMPRKRSKPRRGPLKDPAYLDWIRSRNCAVCMLAGYGMPLCVQLPDRMRSEAAHVGVRGLGQKCHDRQTVPLCDAHHRTGAYAHHVLGKAFWDFYDLDRDKIIAELNRLYEEQW